MDWTINKDTGVFTTKDTITKYNIEFIEFYRESFAKDSMIKYDRGFKLAAPRIKSVLAKSNFQTKLQKMGYQMSRTGEPYALIVYRYKKQNWVDWAKVHGTPVTRFGMLREFSFETGENITVVGAEQETEQYQLFGTFKYDKNDNVIKTVGYYDKEGRYTQTESIKYDTDEIPATIMYNNVLGTADLSEASLPFVKQLADFVNKIPKEFEKGKALFAFNSMINSQSGSKEFKQKIIEQGGDAWDTRDPDNIVANSVSPFTAGMASIDMIMRLYGFYDSRIKEMSFQFRDHGEDSRKSEYDLMTFNQKAHEYMAAKIDFRTRQLQMFIDLLARIMKTKTATVKLVITEFEDNRIKNLNAITELKVAQADQAKGIAKKNTAEANAITTGAAKPVDPTAVNTDLSMDSVETKGV